MKVRLQPPNAQDEFYLINVQEFMKIVDRSDLAQRNAGQIEDAYHTHWLSTNSDGIYLFHAPEFYLAEGIARFINGRHRTLVLSKHLDEIPMALTGMDVCPVLAPHPHSSSVDVLSAISICRVSTEDIFQFPDLPVRYLGYDLNIGK